MDDPVHLGSDGSLSHPELEPTPRQAALAMFMDTLDDVAPEVGESLWETFGSGFPEEDEELESLTEWMSKWGMGDWGQDGSGQWSETNEPYYTFLGCLARGIAFADIFRRDPQAGLGQDHHSASEQRKLGPLFRTTWHQGRVSVPPDSQGRDFPTDHPFQRLGARATSIPPRSCPRVPWWGVRPARHGPCRVEKGRARGPAMQKESCPDRTGDRAAATLFVESGPQP